MDRDSKWHEMILRKKAQIEDINSRLAQPLPRGSHPSNRQWRIEERLHLEEVVADMQREEELRISQRLRSPQNPAALHSTAEAVPPGARAIEAFTHGKDYRTIAVAGIQYTLTTNQALIVEELHAAHKKGLSGCSTEHLLDRLGAHRSRVKDSFRGGDGPCIWKSLVVPNGKGFYRLNIPSSK